MSKNSSIKVTTFIAAGILLFNSVFGGAIVAKASDQETRTPIKHVVVIFQENVSIDHCFGTYPNALNATGETKFTAL